MLGQAIMRAGQRVATPRVRATVLEHFLRPRRPSPPSTRGQMACTLSNRETFAVYNWLSSDLQRLERFRARGERWKEYGIEFALPRMSNMIYEELFPELPQFEGVAAVLFEGGLARIFHQHRRRNLRSVEASKCLRTIGGRFRHAKVYRRQDRVWEAGAALIEADFSGGDLSSDGGMMLLKGSMSVSGSRERRPRC